MNMPIVRLEIEGMKQALYSAFSEHMLMLDEQVREAVAEACKTENVLHVIRRSVKEHLQDALDKEVRDYFMNGKGRDLVRNLVQGLTGGNDDE